MALYTYHCNCCGRDFDIVCPVSERDDYTESCPLCGGDKVKRNIDKSSFIIHGYSEANGYARKN